MSQQQSASFVLLEYVCPSLATVLACAMCAAPVPALRDALQRRRGGDSGTLGNLNPSPWAFMTGNCLGWVAYSFVVKDVFVFYANMPGFLLSLWLNAGAIKLQHAEEYSSLMVTKRGQRGEGDDPPKSGSHGHNHVSLFTPQEKLLFTVVSVWTVILSVVTLLPQVDHLVREDVVGVAANINLIFFFGAPLSTMAGVVKNRDSSSIHRRTLTLNTMDASFWTAYGLAIHDPFVVVPNALGVLLGIVQFFLCLVFPGGGDVVDVVGGAVEQSQKLELVSPPTMESIAPVGTNHIIYT